MQMDTTLDVIETESPLIEIPAFLVDIVGADKLPEKEYIEKLETDRNAVRTKYDLPDRTPYIKREVPIEDYTKRLLELAEKKGIPVLFDFEEYAEIHSLPKDSAGCYSEDIDSSVHLKSDFDFSHIPSIKILEHEIIHGLQFRKTPEMSLELKEYEAYLAADGHSEIFNDPTSREYFLGFIETSSNVQSKEKFVH